MAKFTLPKLYYCNECMWRGYEEKLIWNPYNPVDTFLGIDIRNNPNNTVVFSQSCPNCGSCQIQKLDY